MTHRIRILCAGNELCGDDGVGHRVARILEALTLPPSVSIHHYQQVGWQLIDLLAEPTRVVLVDATYLGLRPGQCTVRRLDAFEPSPSSGLGCHGVSVPALVALASELCPERRKLGVTLVGVEVERIAGYCTSLSSTVERALPEAVERVLELMGVGAELREEGRRAAEHSGRKEPRVGEAHVG